MPRPVSFLVREVLVARVQQAAPVVQKDPLVRQVLVEHQVQEVLRRSPELTLVDLLEVIRERLEVHILRTQ
jgi:hypothetical protein